MGDRRRLRRLGIGAFVGYLFLPEVAILVLLGFALNWWVAFISAGGVFVFVLLLFVTVRSRGPLGRVLGTGGWDPLDYAQWTRYLVIRPLYVSLPASIAVLAAVGTAAAYRASGLTTAAIGAPAGLVGFAIGGWLWLRAERRHGMKDPQ